MNKKSLYAFFALALKQDINFLKKYFFLKIWEVLRPKIIFL